MAHPLQFRCYHVTISTVSGLPSPIVQNISVRDGDFYHILREGLDYVKEHGWGHQIPRVSHRHNTTTAVYQQINDDGSIELVIVQPTKQSS